MKKIALLLPVVALLLLASCSDDDPVTRPAVPTDPVAVVESIADDVTLNAPAQDLDYEIVGNLYRFSYANGQKITYQMSNDATLGRIARVKKIEGATDVVIPASVEVIPASGGDNVFYQVIALDLYQDAANDVKNLTLAKSVYFGLNDASALSYVSSKWLRRQLEMLPALENIELETGFPGYCSINGAIYTSNYRSLVGVPRAKKGIFTIAEDTQIVEDRAFYYCNEITAITFPEGVTEIGKDAVTFNQNLVLINMLPTVAPKTSADSFGLMARTSVLRLPAGSEASYYPVKPDVTEPVPPTEPSDDDDFDVWDQYDIDMAAYNAAMAEYEEIMSEYNNPVGFRTFTNVEYVNF